MPHREQPTITPPESREQPPVDIFVEKKQLFDELKQVESGRDQYFLLLYVFEQSIDDGLELARQCGWSEGGDALKQFFCSERFTLKHPRLMHRLFSRLSSEISPSIKNFVSDIGYNVYKAQSTHYNIAFNPFTATFKAEFERTHPLISKINHYYGRLLAQRQVVSRPEYEAEQNKKTRAKQEGKTKKETRSGEEMGEQYLHDLAPALKGEYELDALTDRVWKKAAEEKLIMEIKETLAAKGYEKDKITVTVNPDTGKYDVGYEGEVKKGGFDLEKFEKIEVELQSDPVENDPLHILEVEPVVICKSSKSLEYLHSSSGSLEAGMPCGHIIPDERLGFGQYIGGNTAFGDEFRETGETEECNIRVGGQRYAPLDTFGHLDLVKTGFAVADNGLLYSGVCRPNGKIRLCAAKVGLNEDDWWYLPGEEEYKQIMEVKNIGGGIYYTAEKDDGKIVVAKKDAGELYEFEDVRVVGLENVGDKLVIYKEPNRGRATVIYPDGHESKAYSAVLEQTITKCRSGEIVFDALLGDDTLIHVFEDGREWNLGEIPDERATPVHIENDAGKIVGTLYNDSSCITLNNDPKKLSQEFDELEMKIVGDKLVIAGVKDRKFTTYKRKIDDIVKDLQGSKQNTGLMDVSRFVAVENKVALLSVLYAPTLEKIADYEKYLGSGRLGEVENKKHQKKSVQESPTFVGAIRDLLKSKKSEDQEMLLDAMSPTRDRLDDAYIESIVERLFPEIKERKEKEKGGQPSWWHRRESAPNAEAYLTERDGSQFHDGDPLQQNAQEVVQFREPPKRFIATNYYGKYDRQRIKWQSIDIPIAPDTREPVKEYTGTLPNIRGLRDAKLPLLMGAEILPERVVGVRKGGQEIPLDVKIFASGLAMVAVEKGVERIVYTQAVSELPPNLTDVTASEYRRWKAGFERKHGTDFSEQIAVLPAEFDVFIDSVKAKSPKEQVVAIQDFVRSIGWYDMKNKEMAGLKDGKSIEERLSIMQARMAELRKPFDAAQGGQIPENKIYAGVCADFNILTAALLRKAGIVSVMAEGFGAGHETITTANAHSVAAVPWPGENANETMMAPVDGTPSAGMPEALREQLILPSIAEMEKIAKEKIDELVAISEEELEEILKIAWGKDEQAIRQLVNGQLERVLNVILEHEVKKSHADVIHGLFNVMEYSPTKIVSADDLADPRKKANFMAFAEYEIRRLQKERKKKPEESNERAGRALLENMRGVFERLAKQTPGTDKEYIFDLMDTAVDACKDYLDPVERRAAAAAITYLRAKKMAGK